MVDAYPIPSSNGAFYRASPAYAGVLREVGLPDAASVFEHPGVTPWRELPDRENCTLDATLADGRAVRLHVKRWRKGMGLANGPAAEEAGINRLAKAGIPTVPFAAAGLLPDGRGFVITEDLAEHDDAEQLLRRGDVRFDELIVPLADLAAKLHAANLHHRDLYLCHFFVNASAPAPPSSDVRLIDAARVKPLPRFFRRRWVVKDLSQFWYSTTKLSVTDAQRDAWLRRYCDASGADFATLRRAVVRKANWIARHDAKLNAKQPTRNVSLNH